MSSWTAASSDCSRPVNNYVHVKTADLYRPNARLTPERQGYQVLTPFGKLGYSQIFGYTEEELLALPSVSRAVSRAGREAAVEQVEQRLRGEAASSPHMLRTRHADGRRLEIEAHGGRAEVEGRPVVIGTMLDVTDREETQDKLRRAERQYRDLFEEAPMMYVVTRSEGGRSVIEDCNNSFLTSLGYTRKEVVGRELGEFARASSPDPDEPWGQGPPQDRVSDQERQLLRKDGGVLQTLIRTVALCESQAHS